MIAGVCRGLADRFGLPVAAVRLGFLLALLLGAMSLIVYVACWIAMPNAPEPPLPTTAAVPPSPSPDGGGGQAA
jgi:phage shock protein PspC (stress-responsive transcriptional regulator)